MAPKAYLAGPDVFLPDAREHARRKVAICDRYGIRGLPPLNEDAESLGALPDDEAWRAIFRKDVERAVRVGKISLAESKKMIQFYEQSLNGYTYLEEP